MSVVIPNWLQEQCYRLKATDCKILNLNLNIRRLDRACLEALVEALNENEEIEVINLTSALIHLSDRCLLPLTGVVLSSHPSLKVLHLSYNEIQNMSALGIALETNNQLVELHMDYNRIDAQSAMAVAHGLRHNTTLRVLQLKDNQIGDEGGVALARMLKCNSTLRELDISFNDLGPQASAALVDALEGCNTTLLRLKMDWNPNVPLEDYNRIQFLVKANRQGRSQLALIYHMPALLPHFLHNLDASSIFYFLRQLPNR